jgi:Flp pilus assembly protein TadG
MPRKSERGNHTLEFTMVGLPLTFLLFSISNMCLSMLTLHTLQEAVEQGARYVVTRGSTCSSGSNTCTATVQQIAQIVAATAVGVNKNTMTLTMVPASGTANQISCNPIATCLSTCSTGCNASRTTVWPTSANSDNSPGKDFILESDCALTLPMFMFWNGTSASSKITSEHFYAYSRQRLMF